mmetsp:Transcript_18237/g.25945  ORF Transcript_18237/g.25945 Transcript_18237/m.25945 type:complete len:530 (+) Transcript_18237:43-1632(+)
MGLLVLVVFQIFFIVSSSLCLGCYRYYNTRNSLFVSHFSGCSDQQNTRNQYRIRQQYASVCCFLARPNIRKLSLELEQIEAREKALLLEEEQLKLKEENLNSIDEYTSLEEESFIEIDIPPEFDNTRIDLVLDALLPQHLDAVVEYFDATTTPTFSRSQIADLIQRKHVLLYTKNKKEIITRKSFKVQTGQTIFLSLPGIVDQLYANQLPTTILPENIPIQILYEDEYMIIVNKPAGMVVHPAAGNWNGTLVNALAYYLTTSSPFGPGEFLNSSALSGHEELMDGITGESAVIPYRPGIVHRLDKGTTGVMVVAKTTAALQALSEMFAQRKVKKTYFAVTIGNPGSRVVIDNYIARHPKERQKMRVVPDPKQFASGLGRSVSSTSTTGSEVAMPLSFSSPALSYSQRGRRAISHVDTRAFDGKLGVAEIRIQTGRTHQIRVHLQDRGTPVYGDDCYGLADWNKKLSKQHGVSRPLLHAYQLELDHHPVLTGEEGKINLRFRAPMAEDMALLADIIWPEGRAERPELFTP